MLTKTLNNIREEKAKLARDIEYLKESVTDYSVEERLMDLEDESSNDFENPYIESANSVDMIPTDTEYVTEEVNRILNADHDIDFDEMVGIEEEM